MTTAHSPGPSRPDGPDGPRGPQGAHGPHGRHGPQGPPHGSPHGGAALPPELAAVLTEIVSPGGGFGHREHIHLAYLAVQRHGARAPEVVSGWIRQLAAYQRTPQKFHATVTRAWVEIVAHHMAAAPAGGFAAFAASYPALLDKRLLMRHYSSRALASLAAKTGWLEPDLAAFPWAS